MQLRDLIELNPSEIHEDNYEKIFQVFYKIKAEDVPRKNIRKIFEISLLILKFKGQQVTSFQELLDSKSNDGEFVSGKLIAETERLKKVVNKLENEKSNMKTKMKELMEEIHSLQNKLQETNMESDKDSSDPLSELDRQEDLLRNISTKNKHIKRLLKDIESLQVQNIEFTKTIIDLEARLKGSSKEIKDLEEKLCETERNNESLKAENCRLQQEVEQLEGSINFLEDERGRSEMEFKAFVEQLEKKTNNWRITIEEKESELAALRQKYEEIRSRSQNGRVLTVAQRDSRRLETDSLLEAVKEKDKIIDELEAKLKAMAREMVESTRLMNKISTEREAEKHQTSRTRQKSCCAETEKSLRASNNRCKELSEMLDQVEEDNIQKSQQAMQAIVALEAYQKGEDGLPQSLRKITNLQQKLASRDKQIKSLIMELNSLHEISQENMLLRKKLNIPEDAIISTTNFIAKQRNKDKMLERMTLKLRASEEMRLQLKLEKNELKKRVDELQQNLDETESLKQSTNLPTDHGNSDDEKTTKVISKEHVNRKEFYCDNCLRNVHAIPNKEAILKELKREWEDKFSIIMEENENLREGMFEILEKIRDYDASSEHITIDLTILEKLLHALAIRTRGFFTWHHQPSQVQKVQDEVREKEEAFREKINLVERNKLASRDSEQTPTKTETTETAEMKDSTSREFVMEERSTSSRSSSPMKDDTRQNSTNNGRRDGELNTNINNTERDTPTIVKNSRSDLLDNNLYPIIAEKDAETVSMKTQLMTTTETNRDLQIKIEKLKCYEIQYHEMLENLKGSQGEITKYCATLVEKMTDQEINLQIHKKKYDFMKEDFDRILTDYRNSEVSNIAIISDLKKQLNNKKYELNLLEENLKQRENKDEVNGGRGAQSLSAAGKEIRHVQLQLSKLIENFFAGKVPEFIIEIENRIEDHLSYGVIDENLEIDFITMKEYEDLKKTNENLKHALNDVKSKCKQLEELLQLTEDQVKTQQRLLSEITDNHMELRHLVADLQSRNEEKFLISKAHRDIDLLRSELNEIKEEKGKLERDNNNLKDLLNEKETEFQNSERNNKKTLKNNDIKIRFLKRSLNLLREKYCKFTPLLSLLDFVNIFTEYKNKMKSMKETSNTVYKEILKDLDDEISQKFINKGVLDSENLINLVKYETKYNFLKTELEKYQRKVTALQMELDEEKLLKAKNDEHWKTICALFDDNHKKSQISKCVQTECECTDTSTNTDIVGGQEQEKKQPVTPKAAPRTSITSSELPTAVKSPSQAVTEVVVNSMEMTILENQLKQAMNLATTRSTLLLETENRLAEAQNKIKELEKTIGTKDEIMKQEIDKISNAEEKAFQRSSSIIETTINTLQSLLSEKDNTVSHYQDLLKSEREQHNKTNENYEKELLILKKTNENLEEKLKKKVEELEKLTKKLSEKSINENQGRVAVDINEHKEKDKETSNNKEEKKNLLKENEKENFLLKISDVEENLEDIELNEISDEKIEEMFIDESKHMKPEIFDAPSISSLSTKQGDREDSEICNKHIKQIETQLREANNREIFWEKSVRAKDEEIILLKEKLALLQEREKMDNHQMASDPEIEQLRILLEEKDKHITDLMETLTSFHEDQQRFINETSLYSADQVSQLSANLSRYENTNKILTTQIDALRRQVANLTQREKQARDLSHSLKTQLIKRPVVSIKTELNSRTKMENLQRRITQLESELNEARKEIKSQQTIIDARKAKNSSEMNLWEKQKRWQQTAEKLKSKLEETESALEKTKALLSSARNTINRLEKERHGSAEVKTRGRCCHAPSCPNLIRNTAISRHRSPESPESSYSSRSTSVQNSPKKMQDHIVEIFNKTQFDIAECNKDLIDALKVRIESQQRKIVALELEGKGSNALVTEVEKLQEKVSSTEAQNVRLEARNLQLQLENDLLRQGDEAERYQKRIKHLEDYIIALKEELAQAEAKSVECGQSQHNKINDHPEQTILALKRIIDRLRVENKNLKDGRRTADSRNKNSAQNSPSSDITRLQHMYAEALDKISALQIELQLKSGYCTGCREKSVNGMDGGGDLVNELKTVKEQLIKKTRLLEKAKILLTRAAAKEKSLKEQLVFWKRKCSELQNVPVIDEISE